MGFFEIIQNWIPKRNMFELFDCVTQIKFQLIFKPNQLKKMFERQAKIISSDSIQKVLT